MQTIESSCVRQLWHALASHSNIDLPVTLLRGHLFCRYPLPVTLLRIHFEHDTSFTKCRRKIDRNGKSNHFDFVWLRNGAIGQKVEEKKRDIIIFVWLRNCSKRRNRTESRTESGFFWTWLTRLNQQLVTEWSVRRLKNPAEKHGCGIGCGSQKGESNCKSYDLLFLSLVASSVHCLSIRISSNFHP